MQVVVAESKEPKGWIIALSNGNLKTYRYILDSEGKFVYVNPFGDARDCPTFDSFELALDHCKEVVNKTLGATVI